MFPRALFDTKMKQKFITVHKKPREFLRKFVSILGEQFFLGKTIFAGFPNKQSNGNKIHIH